MAQIPEEEAERIIQSQMPGYKVVRSQGSAEDSFADSAATAEPDVKAPDLTELRGGSMAENDSSSSSSPVEQDSELEDLYQEFLGKSRSDFVTDESPSSGAKEDVKTSIVTVAPEQPSSDDPIDQSLRRRNVVINPATEEIEGFSG